MDPPMLYFAQRKRANRMDAVILRVVNTVGGGPPGGGGELEWSDLMNELISHTWYHSYIQIDRH